MTLTIEEGKRYIDKAGIVVGPIVQTHTTHPRYADGFRWMCRESGATYRIDGSTATHASSYDLVSEWTDEHDRVRNELAAGPAPSLPVPPPEPASPKKPPLGIMPRKLWVEKRIREINEAMTRYFATDEPVPDEWLVELRDHLNGEREREAKCL
jgi:hypothetical protein